MYKCSRCNKISNGELVTLRGDYTESVVCPSCKKSLWSSDWIDKD